MAAILVADIAGYSRLIAANETETLERLSAYEATVENLAAELSGRIFNKAGDALLIAFDSAVEAARCALTIHDRLRGQNESFPAARHMLVRIGITIGDVVERDGDLLGDGVNVAARLAALADVGGTCVSRAVQEQVVNKLPAQFVDIGEQQLKNIASLVRVYKLLPPGAAVPAQAEREGRGRRWKWLGLELPRGARRSAGVANIAGASMLQRSRPRPRWLQPILWTTFALLLLAHGTLLLFACELAMPHFLARSFCPAPVDLTEAHRLQDQQQFLQKEIDRLQIKAALVPPCATCDPNAPPPGGAANAADDEFVLALDMSTSMSSTEAKDSAGRPIPLPNGNKAMIFDLVRRDLPPALNELGSKQVTYIPFGNCTEARQIARMSGRALASKIRDPGYVPYGGGSPMVSVLEDALKQLKRGPDGKYFGNILIVTDTGPTECNQNACTAVDKLHTDHPAVVVNVIDVGDAGGLRCVTARTGGKFFARGSQVDLKDMFRQARVFRNPDCPDPDAAPTRQRRI